MTLFLLKIKINGQRVATGFLIGPPGFVPSLFFIKLGLDPESTRLAGF